MSSYDIGSDAVNDAVRGGDVATVLSWTSSHDVDARLKGGKTVLMKAACFGTLTVAQALLQAGANPNKEHLVWTALHMACERGRGEDWYRLLLEYGADPTLRDTKGLTSGDLCPSAAEKAVFDRCVADTEWEEAKRGGHARRKLLKSEEAHSRLEAQKRASPTKFCARLGCRRSFGFFKGRGSVCVQCGRRFCSDHLSSDGRTCKACLKEESDNRLFIKTYSDEQLATNDKL